MSLNTQEMNGMNRIHLYLAPNKCLLILQSKRIVAFDEIGWEQLITYLYYWYHSLAYLISDKQEQSMQEYCLLSIVFDETFRPNTVIHIAKVLIIYDRNYLWNVTVSQS